MVDEIKDSRPEIKTFLKSEFKKVNDNKYRDEFLSAHLDPYIRDERFVSVLEKVQQIANI
ncbi:MAG: hypothetical protein PF450_13365 [Bacteroidales bacterium]|nr:hypothetical protein [Bacteroidales bacterium]